MNKDDFDFVALRDLRIGLFVDLDLGWMAHPFASSRFKISSDKQIETLRGLGVARIRYIPAQSDPLVPVAAAPSLADQEAQAARQRAQEAELQRLIRQYSEENQR